jgi:hypothetical protein
MSESSLPGTFACAGASAAGSQIADAIGPILNEIVDRFGRGQRVAVDQALSFGNEAINVGARVGNYARPSERAVWSELQMRLACTIQSLLIRTGSPRSCVSNIIGIRNLRLFPGVQSQAYGGLTKRANDTDAKAFEWGARRRPQCS